MEPTVRSNGILIEKFVAGEEDSAQRRVVERPLRRICIAAILFDEPQNNASAIEAQVSL